MNDRIPLDKCIRLLRARARAIGPYSPYEKLANQLRHFEKFIPEDRVGLRPMILKSITSIEKIEAEK